MTHQPNTPEDPNEILYYVCEAYYPEHEWSYVWRDRNTELREEAKKKLDIWYATEFIRLFEEELSQVTLLGEPPIPFKTVQETAKRAAEKIKGDG